MVAQNRRNKMRYLILFITIFITTYIVPVFANDMQTANNLNIENRINPSESLTRAYCFDKTRCNTILVNKFYITESYQPVWISDNAPNDMALQFISILNKANSVGLNSTTYYLAQINNMLMQLNNNIKLKYQQPSMLLTDFELTMTNAYILYLSHMAFGKIDNRTVYPSWNIKKRYFNIMQLFLDTIHKGDINYAINYVTPQYIGYSKLIEQLNKYQQIEQAGGFDPIPKGKPLRINSKGNRVILLNKRLNLTGELNEQPDSDIFNHKTKNAVIKFQLNNGLAGSVGWLRG